MACNIRQGCGKKNYCPGIEAMSSFIGVALLYILSMGNFNYVLISTLPAAKPR